MFCNIKTNSANFQNYFLPEEIFYRIIRIILVTILMMITRIMLVTMMMIIGTRQRFHLLWWPPTQNSNLCSHTALQHFNTALQHSTTHCIATLYSTLQHCIAIQQHPALQHISTLHKNTLHCNTLQHTSHYNATHFSLHNIVTTTALQNTTHCRLRTAQQHTSKLHTATLLTVHNIRCVQPTKLCCNSLNMLRIPTSLQLLQLPAQGNTSPCLALLSPVVCPGKLEFIFPRGGWVTPPCTVYNTMILRLIFAVSHCQA